MKYRNTKDRSALDSRLISWLQAATDNDPLQGVRATYDILSHAQRVKLVRAVPNSISSAATLVELLEETTEWGAEWAAIVCCNYPVRQGAQRRGRRS